MNCLPFLGLDIKVLEMGGFSMTVYDRSVRELACGLFERGGQRRDDQARGHDAVWDSLRVAVEELVLAVLLMCNKNWFDRAQGFEHRAHLELSSMIMRAAPPPGGAALAVLFSRVAVLDGPAREGWRR